MFDGPLPRDYAKPARPWGHGLGIFTIFLAAVAITIAFGGPPSRNAPPVLRQIEFSRAPGAVLVYVHNAGYRLLHERRLIAVVPGNGPVSADWLGPDTVRVHIPPGITARFTPLPGLRIVTVQ